MTPKGAEDFVAPAGAQGDAGGAHPGLPPRGRRRAPLKRGDLETFRRDAFDLQRVQTEEALHLLRHEDWDLFWVMLHTLDKLQHFFWRYMDPDAPGVSGPGAVRARRSATSTSRSTGRWRASSSAVPPGTPVVLLSDHGSAPLHTYFCVMNWLADAGFLALQRRRRGAPRPRRRSGVDAKARRARAAARGSRLGAAARAARR